MKNEWFEKGNKLYINQEYDKAIEAYTKAIALNPNYAKAYNNRGLVYDKKGQYDRAIEDFNRAIALNPNYAEAYNNRGIAYAKKARHSYGNEIQLYIDKVIADYTIACNLGHRKGCEVLEVLRSGYDRNR